MAAQNSTPGQSQTSQSPEFGSILFREIHKNAWLKRAPSTSLKKKKEKLWVVFCVHDDTDAFLETYVDNKVAIMHKPDWFVYLNEIQHISPTICADEQQEYEFVLTMKSDVVRLTAPSWQQMLDWVTSLQSKLHELRILRSKDNVYTRLPENRGVLLSTRDPNSPLPPPPTSINTDILPGIEALSIEREVPTSLPEAPNQGRISPNISSSARLESSSIFNFDNLASVEHQSEHYDRIFQPQCDPGPSNSNRQQNGTLHVLQPPPQTTASIQYKTCRERQVADLQKQMRHTRGVRFQLRKKDCLQSIAFVDAFGAVWVSGWKQKENPSLCLLLHIGDKLLSLSGVKIRNAGDAYKILESHTGLYVDVIIRRVPFGQVFLIEREFEGQSLGIIQENNTAVIETITEDSLASRYGLTTKTKTQDGLSFTNWVLTEINGRPLNLFYKKNQVKDRLNSVGRDISILVQPLDLIKQLKKELKSFRNYKDYILQ